MTIILYIIILTPFLLLLLVKKYRNIKGRSTLSISSLFFALISIIIFFGFDIHEIMYILAVLLLPVTVPFSVIFGILAIREKRKKGELKGIKWRILETIGILVVIYLICYFLYVFSPLNRL